jgi:hypothetical protein
MKIFTYIYCFGGEATTTWRLTFVTLLFMGKLEWRTENIRMRIKLFSNLPWLVMGDLVGF